MSKPTENINNFYRSQFEKFQKDPPEHVWENIKKSLNHDPAHVKLKAGKKGGISGLTSILMIALIISAYLIYLALSGNISDKSFPVMQSSKNDYSDSYIADHLEQEAAEDFELVFSETRGITTTSQITKPATTKKGVTDSSIPSDPLDQKSAAEKIARTSLLAEEFRGNIQTVHVSSLHQKKANYILKNGNFAAVGTYLLPELKLLEGVSKSPRKITDYRNRGQLMLGIFFTPEIIYYHEDNLPDNRGRSVDLQVLYEKNNVILQAGLGVSQIKDAGHHKIEFNKYLGSYEHVNNVVFDSADNELVVTYITETVHVYDTINYIRISPANRHFTYLQLPVMIGYYKEMNRFKWYVKTGPSFSLKVREQIPDPSVAEGNTKILNIDNNLPGKINTHWQFLISAGTSYKLGNKISLSVEPVFKYYINSDYERNTLSTRHPYSFGLKTGFLLDL